MFQPLKSNQLVFRNIFEIVVTHLWCGEAYSRIHIVRGE